MVQIETLAAIEQLPEIVKLDEIDVIFIGPTDLSRSVGYPSQLEHPEVQAAIQRIIDVAEKTDLALGVMTRNAAGAKAWRERGARYLAIGLEAVLLPAARDFLAASRT